MSPYKDVIICKASNDKKAKTIYSTKVLEKAGNRYVYTVTTMKPNAAIIDSEFIFDKAKYPGVEEVDLR